MEPGALGHICEIVVNTHTRLGPQFLVQSPGIPGDFLGERNALCSNERNLGGSLDGAGHPKEQATMGSLKPSALCPPSGAELVDDGSHLGQGSRVNGGPPNSYSCGPLNSTLFGIKIFAHVIKNFKMRSF